MFDESLDELFPRAAAGWKVDDRIGGLYEIREILGGPGRSGMGVVYVCHYRWHQKVYCLKTYQDRFVGSERLKDAFYKEARLWMHLGRHPNVVQAHWVHNLDGRVYIVLEYVAPDAARRVSLSDHIKDGHSLPMLQALNWAVQFCDGMEYAYGMGLSVHRDIKPDNILISHDKVVKITDFGLSKAFDGEESIGENAAGSPYWMSPEQFEDPGTCTVASDIYSFGVVLYQMTAGRLPFQASAASVPEFMYKMRKLHEEAEVPPADIDPGLFSVLARCLAKSRKDRWASFSHVRGELEALWSRNTDIPPPRPLPCHPLGAREINQKGVALKHLGRPAEAIAYHDEVIALQPTLPNAWNDKGVALWALGRHDEAMKCFECAILLDPEFIQARNNKAALLSSYPGRAYQALACYNEAVAIDPEFIDLWKGKGKLLLRLGSYGDAADCYERALLINRNDIQAHLGKRAALAGLRWVSGFSAP